MNAMHKRYNIGLIVSDIEDDFSNRICRGAMEAAKKTDDNLFIFPVKYLAPLSYFQEHTDILYEYQYNALLSYAQSKSLDAILLCLSCIGYKTTPDFYLPVLDMFEDIPVILLSCEAEGFSSIVYDNFQGIQQGMEKLICERGFTKIGMIRGELENIDVIERFSAYQSSLEEHNIPFDASLVVDVDYGDITKEYLGKWYDEHSDMQAVFCINDNIAKLFYAALKERNIRIGKDIAVIGFDDIEDTVHMDPPLATVRADASLIGARGVEEIHALLKDLSDGKSVLPKRFVVPTTYLHRESASGIFKNGQTETVSSLKVYRTRYEKMIDLNHKMNIANRDMLMFGDDNTESYTALLHALSMEEIPSFYFYLLHHPVSNPDPVTWVRPSNIYLHSYRIGQDMTELPRTQQRLLVDEMFDHSYLPAERKTYILIDIYSRELQYGIFMCELPYEYFHYVEMICYHISTAVKITSLLEVQRNLMDYQESMLRKLQQENSELDNISNTDVLTGIYNRRGFMTNMEHALSARKNQGKQALLFYGDLNYLKQINDMFSHLEGDFSIKFCADALCTVLGKNAIVSRIGGDEFAAFLLTNQPADFYSDSIQKYFAAFNAKHEKPYELNVSVGILPFQIDKELSIDDLLEQADNLLYECKHLKPAFRTY